MAIRGQTPRPGVDPVPLLGEHLIKDHQQTLEIVAMKRDRPTAQVFFNAEVQAESVAHQIGVSLQLFKRSSADPDQERLGGLSFFVM